MQRSENNPALDSAALDAMMNRYRAEILRFQRATAPGKRTLAENLRDITEARAAENLRDTPPAADPPPRCDENGPQSVAPQPPPPAEENAAAPDARGPTPAPAADLKTAEPAASEPSKPDDSPEEPPQGDSQAPVSYTTIEDAEETQAAPPLPEPKKAVLSSPPVQSNRPAFVPAPACAHTEFPKRTGAMGTFRPYDRMSRFTRADFLQRPGEAVDTTVRFSADVAPGGADAVRCRRGFSVRFSCADGPYDLLGMHLPVAMGRSADCLTDLARAIGPSPETGLRDQKRFWRFIASWPQAMHAAVWLYTDLGTVGSYRAVDGYCMPAVWVNAAGERRAVRCRWLSRQRPQTLTRFEAEELAGLDPDAVARDLLEALSAGERPQYELCVQTIEFNELAALPFDPFDPTLVWPEERFALQRIGLLTLERAPTDFSLEIDGIALSADHLVDGIESAPPPSGVRTDADDLAAAGAQLRAMGEFSRRRLIENLAEELSRLDAALLEEVLILFTRADLAFGQALTSALGG